MNHREPPHLPVGVRRALHCLSLLLVPALTLDEGHAGTRLRSMSRTNPASIPYLPVLGSPSLRVAEAPPPPDLVTKPAAAAPPVPALSQAESSVAAANSDAARITPAPDDAANPSPSSTSANSGAPAKTPTPILPDTTRPIIHPEDFLPYFQIPGTARQPGEVNVIVPGAPAVPTSAPLPPSSATYTQTPR